MVRYLLTLCSLLIASPVFAGRALMEAIPATNNAITVSTATGSVYVRTGGTMTVDGNAFSVGTSSFVVFGGSATVANRLTAKSFAGEGSNITGVSVLPAGVDLSTVTAALALKADKGNTAHIDLSTVTAALALKADKGNAAHIDLSTVTAAIALKASKGDTSHIDLSTVTAAIALKLNTADYFPGTSTGVVTGQTLSGNGNITSALNVLFVPISGVDLSTVTAALAGKQASGSYVTNLTGPVTSAGNATSIAGPIPVSTIDLSTVTAAIALKANLSGAAFTGVVTITSPLEVASGGTSSTNRNLYDSSAVSALSWEERVLRNASGADLLDWGSGKLMTATNVPSVHWSLRKLYDTSSNSRLEWGTGNIVINSSVSATGSIATVSSMTASAFFGDGSNLTGIASSTATVIRDYNGNATVPYGVVSSSVVTTYAQVSSVTVGGTPLTRSGAVLTIGSDTSIINPGAWGRLLVGGSSGGEVYSPAGATGMYVGTLNAGGATRIVSGNGVNSITANTDQSVTFANNATASNNLIATYGISAATAVVTYVQVDSVTATTGIQLQKGSDVVIKCGLGSYSTGCMARYFNTWAQFAIYDTEAHTISNGATGRAVNADSTVFGMNSSYPLAWSSTADGSAAKDIGLSRVSAGRLGVGTGAAGSVAGDLSAASAAFSSGITASSVTAQETVQGGKSGFVSFLAAGEGIVRANTGLDLNLDGSSGKDVIIRPNGGNTTATFKSGGSVGIGTASPATTLDVNGNAQFGSGATKSTFTTTGDLLTAGKVYVSTTASGNGNLRVRAGNGNGGGTTPIIMYASTLSSSTWGTDATEWITARSFTIPGNTLANDGDALDVYCVTTATSTSYSKGIEFQINGTRTNTGAVTTTDAHMTARLTLFRQSATAVGWHAVRMRDAAWVSDKSKTQAITLSSDFVVTCELRASASADPANEADANMVLKYMKVTYEPAP